MEKISKWSEEYKDSIDCDNPKGFSQRAHCQGLKKKKEKKAEDILHELHTAANSFESLGFIEAAQEVHEEFLRLAAKNHGGLDDWFQEKWVRFGPDGKIRGDCARGDDSEGKPKCLPQSKAHSLGKKGRASAAQRKRREDPNPERSGKAINVNTKKGKG
jgi:hypothetical protein